MVIVRPATHEDLPELHGVIERAYRGESARLGWTHEADLIGEAPRTDLATLAAIVDDARARLLMASEGDTPIGSVHVADLGGGLAHLGLLSVEPAIQAKGVGRLLIDAAEACARDTFGATRMEMDVIDRRADVVAYYERRGYARTGEKRNFPIPLDPPLFLSVLVKRLA